MLSLLGIALRGLSPLKTRYPLLTQHHLLREVVQFSEGFPLWLFSAGPEATNAQMFMIMSNVLP